MEVRYLSTHKPVIAFVVAKLLQSPCKFTVVKQLDSPSPLLTVPQGPLSGDLIIAKYLARLDSKKVLYGTNDAFVASEVDMLIDLVAQLAAAADPTALLAALDKRLVMRMFVACPLLTVADVALWTAMHTESKLLAAVAGLGHLKRWMEHCNSMTAFQDAKVQLLGLKDTRKDQGGSFNIDLPGAEEGKVVTRFPPEPSGYLHIGHAKAALLNNYYARQYNGKLIVRFDDTNPSKEKGEFEEAILNDLATLRIKPDQVTHTSDHIPKLLQLGEKIIKMGLAYADSNPAEVQREERGKKQLSKFRDATVEENLRLWEEMKKGSEEGLKCNIRAKMDPSLFKNSAMRDPAFFRCNQTPHHILGRQFNVYPTYDFACPVVDSWEGVTHALRDRQYQDRNEQYDWVLNTLQLRKVHIYGFSRVNFQYCLLSKRKLQWFVDEGHVEGWDDPRVPSIQGIIRRGLHLDALQDFILEMGASKNINLMTWDKIWAKNKQKIDPICGRYSAVMATDRVRVRLTDIKQLHAATKPKYQKNAELGNKVQWYGPSIWMDHADASGLQPGEEVTLMGWGNAIVKSVDKAADGSLQLTAVTNLQGDVKSTKKKISWVVDSVDVVQLSLVETDHLINKEKLDEDEEFKDHLNTNTKMVTTALGDPNLRNLQKGDYLQLERKGYYKVDTPYIRKDTAMTLIFIPDGRVKK